MHSLLVLNYHFNVDQFLVFQFNISYFVFNHYDYLQLCYHTKILDILMIYLAQLIHFNSHYLKLIVYHNLLEVLFLVISFYFLSFHITALFEFLQLDFIFLVFVQKNFMKEYFLLRSAHGKIIFFLDLIFLEARYWFVSFIFIILS